MNDSQNPNVNTTTSNGTVPATTPNVAPSVTPEVSFTIGSEQVTAPSAPAAPAPVSPAPVQAAPQPVQTPAAPTSTPVEPITPVQSTMADSPFFTPVSVQPDTQVSPELPPIEPAQPAQPVQAAPQSAPVQQPVAAAPAQPVAAQPQVVAAPTTPVETAPANQVEVIETVQKSKASNFILIIFLVLLILFVFNIDTVISMYDQYKNSGVPQNPINKNTNNLTDGFILINENSSSIRVKDIKFYNFRQSQGKGITFSYEVLAKVEDAKKLDIYIELYNSEKEIIYKELYNPSQKLEKDTVRTYTISVENEVYDAAFYALVKVYTDEEKAQKTSLTCSSEDKNYYYKHTYNFVNNGLSTYDIEKSIKKKEVVVSEDETETETTQDNAADKRLQEEYELLKDTNHATLEDGVLKYTVDVNTDNDDLLILFEPNTTLKVIKDTLTAKEWKCE